MTSTATTGGPDGAEDTASPAADWARIVGELGPKVHALRQARGLSLQQLAQRSEVSAAAIHKVERGEMVPTVTTLLKLAASLGTPIGHFVEADAAPGPVAAFTPADGRPRGRSEIEGVEVAELSGPPGRFRVKAALTTVAPGSGGGVPRAGEDLVFVLDGSLRIEVAGEPYLLRKGDALHFPTDREHRWENPGRGVTRTVWVSLPES
ncbi:MAG TPA: cupin domain-containing protein [Pseudonocardia sp.]|jgi:transcriptional regulator with XRE-family HTH domain|nr:cupin domain-containing protein [Pseudonocardia sp.]